MSKIGSSRSEMRLQFGCREVVAANSPNTPHTRCSEGSTRELAATRRRHPQSKRKMFSGFDNFAEGFKRFSLDSLQQQEDDDDGEKNKNTYNGEEHSTQPSTRTRAQESAVVPHVTPRLPVVPEHAQQDSQTIGQANDEDGEWDWDEKGPGSAQKESRRSRKDYSARRSTSNVNASDASDNTPTHPAVPLTDKTATLPVRASENDYASAHERQSIDDGCAAEMYASDRWQEPAREADADTVAAEGKGREASVQGEDGGSERKVADASDLYGNNAVEFGERESDVHSATAAFAGLPDDSHLRAGGEGDSLTTRSGELAREEMVKAGSQNAEEAAHADHRVGGPQEDHPTRPKAETPESVDGGVRQESALNDAHGRELDAKDVPQSSTTVKAPFNGVSSASDVSVERDRSELGQLRDMLAMEQDTTRKQAEKISSFSNELQVARVQLRESNEAHQRTAERSHGLEQQVHMTQQAVDSLKAEKSSLIEQLSMALENRHALEAQLRHLQAGLTEGQEAARQEGRLEVERLNAKLSDLLKDRERKQAELDLQNARRKETREMARDLEAQLAAVDRIAQDREEELKGLRNDTAVMRKNAGDAVEEKKHWATKYDALERNFKQIRGQSRRIQTELEEVGQFAARLEAEKGALAERLEEEGAERVTVVASISHERDFLLRQVDRLEEELSSVQRSQETQAAKATARAQTAGALEEYRTRAQQALKRANEIATQTADENKRLEEEVGKLFAEVAQQRPVWEKSKELEEHRYAEVEELRQRLAADTAERERTATATASFEERLAGEEEERRRLQASVVRLESQSKSLKQEVQRQQKVLVAAKEREKTLQMRLEEKASALQAAEECDLQNSKPTQLQSTSRPPTPRESPGAPSVSLGWEEDKETARNGMATDSAGADWRNRRRDLGESFASIPSEGESVDASSGGIGEQLFYVHQLRERMSREQVEMRSLISELEASRTAADAQAARQSTLEKQLEAALLDKKRLQELDSGRNAAINLEYLKNCVVGCLRTSEPSEHARLLPVITTILKLSTEEADVIAKNISTRAHHQGSFGGSLPAAAAGPGAGARASGGGSWWKPK